MTHQYSQTVFFAAPTCNGAVSPDNSLYFDHTPDGMIVRKVVCTSSDDGETYSDDDYVYDTVYREAAGEVVDGRFIVDFDGGCIGIKVIENKTNNPTLKVGDLLSNQSGIISDHSVPKVIDGKLHLIPVDNEKCKITLQLLKQAIGNYS